MIRFWIVQITTMYHLDKYLDSTSSQAFWTGAYFLYYYRYVGRHSIRQFPRFCRFQFFGLFTFNFCLLTLPCFGFISMIYIRLVIRKTSTGESTRDRRDWKIAVRTASPGGLVLKFGVHSLSVSDGPHLDLEILIVVISTKSFPNSSVLIQGLVSWCFKGVGKHVLIDGCGIYLQKMSLLFYPWATPMFRVRGFLFEKGFHSGHTAQEQIKDLKTEIARHWKGCLTFVLLECAKYTISLWILDMSDSKVDCQWFAGLLGVEIHIEGAENSQDGSRNGRKWPNERGTSCSKRFFSCVKSFGDWR